MNSRALRVGLFSGHRNVAINDTGSAGRCPLWVKSRHLQPKRHVRFWPLADLASCTAYVRFLPKADIDFGQLGLGRGER